MKKYQLKWNDGNELVWLVDTDRFNRILEYLNNVEPETKDMKFYSVWMDGVVLE